MNSRAVRCLAWALVGSALTFPRAAEAQFTTVLNIPPDPDIGDWQSIGSDTQLNLGDGGSIGRNFHAGASDGSSSNVEVNISGGEVGHYFDAFLGSTVNISGGSVGFRFDASGNTVVNISGGTVGNAFSALDSTVNISGGTVGDHSVASSGSTVSISGGSIGGDFDAEGGSNVNISGGRVGGISVQSGSTVDISGGVIGDSVHVSRDSTATIRGSEFRLDGAAIPGLEHPGDSVTMGFRFPPFQFSGTLQDGMPFAFSNYDSDAFPHGTLTLVATELPAVGPAEIELPDHPAPLGIRDGQTLTVSDGGVLADDFNAGWGSTVMITGGEVGDNFEAVGATVSISGGTIGSYLDAFHGSTVTISDGVIGSGIEARGELTVHGGSILDVSGGTIHDQILARAGSSVAISGGTLAPSLRSDGGSSLTASDGSDVTISGGTALGSIYVDFGGRLAISGGTFDRPIIALRRGSVAISGGTLVAVSAREESSVTIAGGVFQHRLTAWSNSTISLYGTEFLIDGSDITASLIPSVPFTIADRDVTLSGLFVDGTPFSFDLNSVNESGEDYFAPDAVLTVTLVLPGDFNGDGLVDAADYTVWRDALGATVSPGTSADANFDGVVDHSDRLVWRANFGDSTADGAAANTIPEPATLVLLSVASCLLLRCRAKRND